MLPDCSRSSSKFRYYPSFSGAAGLGTTSFYCALMFSSRSEDSIFLWGDSFLIIFSSFSSEHGSYFFLCSSLLHFSSLGFSQKSLPPGFYKPSPFQIEDSKWLASSTSCSASFLHFLRIFLDLFSFLSKCIFSSRFKTLFLKISMFSWFSNFFCFWIPEVKCRFSNYPLVFTTRWKGNYGEIFNSSAKTPVISLVISLP